MPPCHGPEIYWILLSVVAVFGFIMGYFAGG